MTGQAIISLLTNISSIEGADKIQQAKVYGETVIVPNTYIEGQLGVQFDCETQLSHEFCYHNNLYRHSNLNKDTTVSGYIDDNRRVRPITLRGVRCSGLWLPISSLNWINGIIPTELGYQFNTVNGEEVCQKYIVTIPKRSGSTKEDKVSLINRVHTFKEHVDTDQWSRNIDKLQFGDLVYITEKLHGTSGRCGYLPVLLPKDSWWQRFVDILTGLLYGISFKESLEVAKSPDMAYQFVVGSRRVVKSIGLFEKENSLHYYNEDIWTKVSKENFENKLKKGETVYFEIVGYTPSGELIMPSVSNIKLENFIDKKEYKEFIDKYRETTVFSYGCDLNNQLHGEPSYKIFVYRITMTNEDGESIDYSWKQVKQRCIKLGVNHVPELFKTIIKYKSDIVELERVVNYDTDNESKLFPQHIREGVCIRIENGNFQPLILKNKSFIFKVLDGIVKDLDIQDIEENN